MVRALSGLDSIRVPGARDRLRRASKGQAFELDIPGFALQGAFGLAGVMQPSEVAMLFEPTRSTSGDRDWPGLGRHRSEGCWYRCRHAEIRRLRKSLADELAKR
jgi:hypothetical protein